MYYCCWNTSYCDEECQKAHWNHHFKTCTRVNNVAESSSSSLSPAYVAQQSSTSNKANDHHIFSISDYRMAQKSNLYDTHQHHHQQSQQQQQQPPRQYQQQQQQQQRTTQPPQNFIKKLTTPSTTFSTSFGENMSPHTSNFSISVKAAQQFPLYIKPKQFSQQQHQALAAQQQHLQIQQQQQQQQQRKQLKPTTSGSSLISQFHGQSM